MKYLIVLIVTLFISCSIQPDLSLKMRQEIELKNYNVMRNGNGVTEIPHLILDKDSDEVKIIYEWLEQNKDWDESKVSFVKGYCWKIDSSKFNLLKNTLILEQDGRQFYQKVSSKDTTFHFMKRIW